MTRTTGSRLRRPPSPSTGSWDAFRASRPYQSVWVSLGVLFLLPGLVATFLRIVPPSDDAPALVASFISYAVFAYLAALCCFAVALIRARRRQALGVLAALAAGLLGCHLCWLAPLFVPDVRPASTPTFTLMSLNLHNGRADSKAVAQRAQTADVVIFLEATSTAVRQLKPYGWDRRFPYSVGDLEPNFSNTIIFSRFPLTDGVLLAGSKFEQWIATADVPDLGPVRIIAAHPCNPYCGSNLFAVDHARLRAAADANLGVPLIVAGDLNAVDDHGPMRQLRRDGLESATDIVGAGWLPTYPANSTIPPLVPIDHVLVNHFLTATSIQRFQVPGTDHLGLMVQLAGTRS